MPCYSVVLNSVELKLCDDGLLGKALREIGAVELLRTASGHSFVLNFRYYRIDDGKLIGPGNLGPLADQIKQAYSRATIKKVAKKRGWKVVADKRNPNRLEVYR
jgi:hypothetical protein